MANRQQNIEDFDFSIVDFKGHWTRVEFYVLTGKLNPYIK